MKSISYVLVLVISLSFYAQERDTSRYGIGGLELIMVSNQTEENDRNFIRLSKNEKKAADYSYWQGIDLGLNGYLWEKEFLNNDPEYPYMNLNIPRSWTISLNLGEYTTEIIGEKFLVTSGFGFRFNRYALSSNIHTLSFNDTSVFATADSLQNYTTNFSNASYFSVPIIFTLVPGKDPKNSFHIGAGLIANVRMGSRLKQRFEFNNESFKNIKRGTFNLNPFLFDATVRVGVGRFSIFGTYGLTSMFERNIGPENYRQFSIGLTSRL